MRSLDRDVRSDTQLWGTHYMHAMNISDEIVTGQERLGGKKSDVGGVSTGLYKLRPLATIGHTGALAVPADMLSITRDLNRYHREIGINNLSDDRIIPIHETSQYGYSGAIVKAALSTQSILEGFGINKLNGFIESHNLQLARSEMGFSDELGVPYHIVDSINNKGVFLQEMEHIGVPTAYGKTVFTPDDVYATFFEMKKTGAKQVYAKLARAASGQGVFALDVNTPEQLEVFLKLPQTQEQLPTLGIRIDYGIEDIIDSPNVMIYVGKTPLDDRFISASSQLLAKRNPEDTKPTVHKGNISGLDSDIQSALIAYSQKVAYWMRSKGAYGIVGLDYVITSDKKIYIMEANYRVNGGLAAAMKAHDLGSPYWAASGGTKVPKNTSLDTYIQHLQSSGIEYNKGENSGVIILNPATSPAGSMQIAVLGKTKKYIHDIMLKADLI